MQDLSSRVRGFSLSVLLLVVGFGNCSTEQDPSLSISEYQNMGVPDPGVNWGSNDYSKAFESLFKLKLQQPYALPKMESKRSGVLFARLIDLKNLEFLHDDSIPLNQKAHLIKDFLRVHQTLVDLYNNVLMKEQYYHQELMGIHLFGLSIRHQMLALAMMINESSDQKDMAMSTGYSSIRGIYKSFLEYSLQVQFDTAMYTNQELELLSDSITVSLVTNRNHLHSTELAALLGVIDDGLNNAESEYIEQNYQQLLLELQD